MALIDRLRDDFDETTRTKGRNYFDRGAVDVTRYTHRSVAAAVQGEQRYLVDIDWDSGFLEFECSCDDFRLRRHACKHIWAALLEAQRKGRLPPDEADEIDEQDGNGSGVRKHPIWKQRLSELKARMSVGRVAPPNSWPGDRQMVYVVDASATQDAQGVHVELMYRGRRRDGGWEKPKPVKGLQRNQLGSLPDALDRRILQMLIGAQPADYQWGFLPWDDTEIFNRFNLPAAAFDSVLKTMCQSGRCRLRQSPQDTDPPELAWDEGPTWQFFIGLKSDAGGAWKVDGGLRRGQELMRLNEPDLVVAGGLVFAHGKVALLDDGGAFELLAFLRRDQKIAVRAGREKQLLQELFTLPRLPALELPPELGIERLSPVPSPRLKVRPPTRNQGLPPDSLCAELTFDYSGQIVSYGQGGSAIFFADQNRLVQRDAARERAAAGRLLELGFKGQVNWPRENTMLLIGAKLLPIAVRSLASEGWRIEAEGKLYRNAGAIRIDVRSNIDWFEVHAVADFEGAIVPLPRLLAALRRGENTITLDDGTVGILPEEWLAKYGLLAGVGTEFQDHLRFKPTQAGLLDALLAARPEATFDAGFSAARAALAEFSGIREEQPPAQFIGELRPYQKEGLGWMSFMRRFGFGGCLADDMGLGKTVQVLALLEARRQAQAGTSLVVVPRSLVFNWEAEAARFAPLLKILDHSGPNRDKSPERFREFDLILTTYGTVRNDAPFMKDFPFDYVILDEAQAVKNALTESAKAVRLLNGKFRLALSGTPVQNHLGELWSLFEFLNPGMLGSSSALAPASGGARNLEPETAGALGRALRPFILRRTKDQVARELPERLEQTLYCDLDPVQRKQYDELRDHYRQSLWKRIERDGLGKSKIMVLEALLRLRQAACHPGLIDKSRTGESSAKLETLLMSLEDVHEEGHKALVFSQFTSLLAIVRQRLDAENISYEYLDGKTRDREERVQRFQTDPECKLFLVSLKAGGLGLNLTAAEYVFLLDPWWNPAVEAQAIDRAHRIGQTRRVFAYRLITRDTVEQKVLELQQTKRDLADAIITADNRTLATLKREDLELLLS
jgi:superfamily II DNA or RNA helicase